MQPLAAILLIIEIAKGLRHQDYKHVEKLTKKYRQLFLGEDIEELVVQYSPREDEQTLKVRKKYVIQHCAAWASSMMADFNEVYRIRPVAKGFRYIDKDKEKASKLQEAINTFFGNNNIDFWQKERIHNLSFIDPNAFAVVEIGEFDNLGEKAKPYPFIVESEDVLYFNYVNDVLESLGVEVDYEYIVNVRDENGLITAKKVDGDKYTLYLAGYALTLTPVDPSTVNITGDTGMTFSPKDIPETIQANAKFVDYHVKVSKDTVYRLDVYYNGIDQVNAFRIGKKRDELTDGRTCISLLDPAVSYMEKSVNAISEMDITYLSHVFPQKAQYAKTCKLDFNGMCPTSGENVSTCSKCKGTGMPVVKTSSDILIVPLPTDMAEGAQLQDLSKMVYYFAPDVEIVKVMTDRITQLESDAYAKVFNTDEVVKANIADSATQKLLEKQAKYNAYLPFAEKVAEIYKTVVYLIAAWRDEQTGLIVEYILPGDFKLETLGELLTTLKTAADSGLPAPLMESITNDIAGKMYADQPQLLKVYLTKQYFNPFRSKTDVQVQAIMANSLVSYNDKVLWANFDTIFSKIIVKQPKFYEIQDLSAQVTIVDEVVAEFVNTIKAENTTAVTFGA